MKEDGLTVGLCHGCFDLLHYGHLLHFHEALTRVNRLVVTVTADRFIDKGAGRPVLAAPQRAEMLAALRVIDGVAVSDAATAVVAIEALRPDVFVKGRDYQSVADHAGLKAEIAAVRRVGASMYYTESPKWSSSYLLTHLADVFRKAAIETGDRHDLRVADRTRQL